MMRAPASSILVTGAAGFVGRGLVARLLALPDAPELVLVDTGGLEDWAGRPGVTCVLGSIADRAVLGAALGTALGTARGQRPRVVFHLASVPGGLAERDYALGRAVNLDGTAALLELLAGTRGAETQGAGPPPVLVFASSIAVFGGNLPDPVHEDQPAAPLLSYGAQKLIGEVMVADFARRGWVDGRSLRLPGIITRPPGAGGAISIFLSDLVRELPLGREVVVPMSPRATTWLMSRACAVDNLLHAAGMTGVLPASRVWTPPPLCVGMAAFVAAIGAHAGRDVSHLVRYAPSPAIEAAFGASPPLISPNSRAAGFRNDLSLAELIQNAQPEDTLP